MYQKLSQLKAPVLAGVVKEKTAASAIAEIKNCIYEGAGSTMERRDWRTGKEAVACLSRIR